MARNSEKLTDQQMEQVLGKLLITGVVVAAVVVLAGGIIYLIRHGGEAAAYQTFQGELAQSRTVSGILKGVAEGRGRGLIQLGLLLLIATPVARVALSLVAFARRRDLLYTIFTMIVLGVLLFSLMGRHL
ncbi:MAG TPA: DUF1634 domain-containing protein [Terriglobia bacterium]